MDDHWVYDDLNEVVTLKRNEIVERQYAQRRHFQIREGTLRTSE